MKQVGDRILIGTTSELAAFNGGKVNVSGKYHKEQVVGMRRIPQDHPNYVVSEQPTLISVNWVDAAEARYFNWNNQGTAVCAQMLDFIDRQEGSVLIACDQGLSRSPSVALLHLAKRQKVLEDDFARAVVQFRDVYPDYAPGQGIYDFLKMSWDQIE